MSELDDFLPPRPATRQLGVVTSGSLSRGLEVKLTHETPVESIAVGQYVIIEGNELRFFGMLTDVALDNTNPQLEKSPPDVSNDFMREVYAGISTFGRIHVSPLLVVDVVEQEPRPVKTIPGHFSVVRSATEEDVNMIFGANDDKHFHIGEPIDMEDVKVHLNLDRMVERSVGVFGKTGTGKSFLTRLLLAGIIKQNVGVALIFDMHNDYGWAAQSENKAEVKGLKQLFENKVSIVTLDEESTRRRRAKYDFSAKIKWSDISPEDLETLRSTLNLTDTMIGAAYTLRRQWGRDWIKKFLEADQTTLKALVEETSLNRSSLDALSRRLETLERFDFIVDEWPQDSAKRMLEYLESGVSIVLEFGKYGNSLTAYMLVANYLTRRIHEMYVKRVEESLSGTRAEPPPLMIVIEEAHKFLDPHVAHQTIFGTIARELRKYKVTLLVVDQRPSGIDEEIMSQIGTRVTALLDNEKDLSAVFTGVSGAGALREVLARLDTKQQALIMGHAVPMPVVIQTRSYDSDFYQAVGFKEPAQLVEQQTERRSMMQKHGRKGIE